MTHAHTDTQSLTFEMVVTHARTQSNETVENWILKVFSYSKYLVRMRERNEREFVCVCARLP